MRLLVGKKKLAGRWLRVAQYRAPRFAVRTRVEPDTVVSEGEVEASIQARFLFGGALDGAAYRVAVSRYPGQIELPRNSGYHAGGSAWALGLHSGKVWHRRSGVLDGDGRAREVIRIDPGPPKLRRWYAWHRVEAEARSPAGRTVSSSDHVSYHPGALYAARKRLPGKGTTLRHHVRVVDTRGRPRGGNKVVARLHRWDDRLARPDWSSVLWCQEAVVGPRGRMFRTPFPGKAAYEGDIALLSFVVTDASGRESWTADRLHRPAGVRQRRDRRESREQRREAQLGASTDRKRYRPGATATITVRRKGLTGPAMLFIELIERERTFRALRLRFDGAGVARVRVRVDRAFARHVRARAVALRKGRDLRSELGPYVVASTRLRVSDEPYRLKVALSADRRVYRPGQKVQVAVRIADQLGAPRRARVVLMAVDEAVLRLTGYRLPDPYTHLAHTSDESVVADDVRRHLLPLGIPLLHRDFGAALIGSQVGTIYGAGGLGITGTGRGAGGSASGTVGSGRKRTRFLTTAWHATVMTDARGRARKQLPARPRAHGLTVTRQLQVLDNAGRRLARQRPPRLDDTVLFTLRVDSTEARRYVVVDDPLPAGLEAIDHSLATAGRSFGGHQAWANSSRWDHRELRDDRVLFFRDHKQPGRLTYRYLARVTTPGTFVVPPTRAEEMYTPEVFGHTAAATVTFGP